MNEEKQKNLLGYACIIAGGIFIIAGIILFIASNHMNLQMHKVEAEIMGRYDMTLDSGLRQTMLDLAYRVGDEMVQSSYVYPGIVEEDVLYIEIYYNVKEPTMVLEGKWLFEPLLVVGLGVIILIPGLMMKDILQLKEFRLKKPGKNAGQKEKELYEAKKTVIEDILPIVAGILFVVFGIVMLLTNGAWWCWIFIIAGGIDILYIAMEMIPAAVRWRQLVSIDKLKGKVKVYDVETTQDEQDTEQDKK